MLPALRHPVILAPLAGGPSTPELAAAVTNAGGLGFLAGGYLAAEELRARIRGTRALTAGPIGVNLFVLEERPVDRRALLAFAQRLAVEAEQVGVKLGYGQFEDDQLDAKLAVVRDELPEVVSLTFGCLPAAEIGRLRELGVSVWATVSCVAEAHLAEAAGVDALVVQGQEAGGHRASWTDDDADAALLPLLHAITKTTELPLVAAGGIVDGATARAAREAGALGVQAGTAFLLCPEAGTHPLHREALARGGRTATTRAFTGRRARGLENGWMRRFADAPSAYPQIHHLTVPLRAAARARGDADGVNLWAGERFAAARAVPAAEVVAALAP